MSSNKSKNKILIDSGHKHYRHENRSIDQMSPMQSLNSTMYNSEEIAKKIEQ